MSYSKDQIEKFMQLGKPRDSFTLRWADFESFFDAGVQAVLRQFHPERYHYSTDSDKAFAVVKWSIVNDLCQYRNDENWAELFPCFERLPLWTAELLAAVMHCQQREFDSRTGRAGEDIRTVDAIRNWRAERYLWESARIVNTHEEAVKIRTLNRRAEAESQRLPKKQQALLGGPPLGPVEALRPPRAWMDGKRKLPGRGLTPEAFRQAAHKENARRDAIMLSWAECWLACSEFGVTKTPPKK